MNENEILEKITYYKKMIEIIRDKFDLEQAQRMLKVWERELENE